jgi:hypothetical protein
MPGETHPTAVNTTSGQATAHDQGHDHDQGHIDAKMRRTCGLGYAA